MPLKAHDFLLKNDCNRLFCNLEVSRYVRCLLHASTFVLYNQHFSIENKHSSVENHHFSIEIIISQTTYLRTPGNTEYTHNNSHNRIYMPAVGRSYLLQRIYIHNKSHNLPLISSLNCVYIFPGVGNGPLRIILWRGDYVVRRRPKYVQSSPFFELLIQVSSFLMQNSSLLLQDSSILLQLSFPVVFLRDCLQRHQISPT